MLSLIPQKSYKISRENINYLFVMNKKERAAFRLKNLLNTALNSLDFNDINNQRMLISFSVCVAIITVAQPVFAVGTGLEWADRLGNKFLHYSQSIGQWVCVIKAIAVLIQSVSQDTLSKCWKNIVGYGVAAVALHIIPEVFFSLR